MFMELLLHVVTTSCLAVCLPPDPSLIPDNILQSTRNIPLWNSRDSNRCLDMPFSLHDAIVAKYNGEQAKRELFSIWLASHPCPTWKHVEGLLRRLESKGRGREGAADEVEETYMKSELQCFSQKICTCAIVFEVQSHLDFIWRENASIFCVL